ncbi:hypothetical protein H5J25_14725 [Sphingomonas aliaeris]|uniref:Uncharacterized protein n=1 Tax=Sphingomonas aliaeris TaxID=2759526 RepID=A0A974NTL4_9SPHN|nr:hypothetical protein [Sphingomonas aliaeris]QQV76671.1 hypothetical protein H5J25_14725 [Sphingomonas aliaeris]
MKHGILLGVAAIAAPVVAVAAQADQSAEAVFAQRLVNDPRAEALRPYGQPIPPEVRSDKTVQFGKALRIPISSAAQDFWRVGIVTPTLKPVKESDRLVVAFWARAQRTEANSPGKLCRVQLEATPVVRTIFEQAFDITPEWKMYKISGKADRAYPAGGLNAAFHLACAKQTIDIGPVFILDYGQ